METYRRLLERHCQGQQVMGVEIGREKSLNVPVQRFTEAVQGARLSRFERRAKHLVFRLSNGLCLLNHLMLGGGLFYGTAAEAPERTYQVVLHLEGGRSLYWFGLRLGWLHLLDAAGLEQRLADLGVDPLDPAFTADHLRGLLRGRRKALKPLLVEQRFFPGIGNCYADEICWTAGLHPLRPPGALTPAEAEQLWHAIGGTLGQAVALGGYTETPFHTGDRLTGGYLPHLKVYDRKGEPCPRCSGAIAYAEETGRKVFWCPRCQPEEPAAVATGMIPAPHPYHSNWERGEHPSFTEG